MIRDRTVADGLGGPQFDADVAVIDGRIPAVGAKLGAGIDEIDVRGKLVTPGVVDIHTQCDGQVTCEDRLSPSSVTG